MTTATLDSPVQSAAKDFASELRSDTVAIRLEVNRVGRTRSMSTQQKHEVADHFSATYESVSGSKRLFPKNCPEIKAITSALGAIVETWKNYTLFYPEKAVRLIRRDRLNQFSERFDVLKAELKQAVAAADAVYEDILVQAKADLGDKLFNRGDYPPSFSSCINVSWRPFNFEPSEELLKLAPETYRREQARVRALFETSVAEYEAECKKQMSDLVGALLEKLTPSAEGEKPKVFKEAATTNLREFFTRFESMGVFSDESLNELVSTAKKALGGTKMADLKKNAVKAGEVSQQFSEIKAKLDVLLVEAPTRKINLEDLSDDDDSAPALDF